MWAGWLLSQRELLLSTQMCVPQTLSVTYKAEKGLSCVLNQEILDTRGLRAGSRVLSEGRERCPAPMQPGIASVQRTALVLPR